MIPEGFCKRETLFELSNNNSLLETLIKQWMKADCC